MDLERVFGAAAFALAGGAAGWAALACRNARQRGRAGADARVWIVVALLFLGLACARAAYVGPWLGAEARRLARAAELYGDRRPYQLVATLALTIIALGALGVGVRSIWNALKLYRLAAASVAVVLASAMIRFVSLHEVDAWQARWPWARLVLDTGNSALATAAAVTRAREIFRADRDLRTGGRDSRRSRSRAPRSRV